MEHDGNLAHARGEDGNIIPGQGRTGEAPVVVEDTAVSGFKKIYNS